MKRWLPGSACAGRRRAGEQRAETLVQHVRESVRRAGRAAARRERSPEGGEKRSIFRIERGGRSPARATSEQESEGKARPGPDARAGKILREKYSEKSEGSRKILQKSGVLGLRNPKRSAIRIV